MTDKSHDGDVAFIRALAELLKANDLTELEVKRDYGEDNSLNVRVSRAAPAAAQLVAPVATPSAPAAITTAPEPAPTPPQGSADPAAHPGVITSPMVGTAYLQPEPGAPSFVSQGAQVKEGETILIIEAMKTMNQIPAPRSGTVTRILVDDGSPVEYGAPLMIIE